MKYTQECTKFNGKRNKEANTYRKNAAWKETTAQHARLYSTPYSQAL